MREKRLLEPEPTTSESEPHRNKGRRLQTGMRTLVVLVASCGVMFWAARHVWESQHPAYVTARGLQSHSRSERVNAARLMEQVGMGDAAVAIPPLIAALRDAEPEVRVAACVALGPLIADAVKAGTSADAVRTAVTAMTGLLEDPKPQIRIAVAEALSGITSLKGSAGAMDLERVFVTVSGRLGDQDADVRIAVLHALDSTAGKVTHPPPAALRANLADESAAVRAAALRALVSFQRDLDRWIPAMFEVLEHEEGAGARARLSYVLDQIKPPAFSAAALPALVKGLDSHHRDIAIRASWLIAELGRDAGPAIPSLLTCMSHPIDTAMFGSGHPSHWDPGWVAAEVLVKISSDTPLAGEVIEALSEVIRTGHPYRREAAANALSRFGQAAVGAVPALISVIRENAATKAEFGDGSWATMALGRIAPDTPLADEAVSCLIEALQARSEYTRECAIEALLRFGPKAANSVPRLRALVNDERPAVGAAAARALTVLGGSN